MRRKMEHPKMCRSMAVIPLILAIACTNAQNVTSAQRDRATIRCELTDDDYAVYAAILEWFKDPAKALPTKQLLIVDETVSMEGRNFEADWGAKSKSPGLETIADFTAKKGDVCSMKPELETLHGYALVSSEEIDGYFRHGIVNGWRAFYANIQRPPDYGDSLDQDTTRYRVKRWSLAAIAAARIAVRDTSIYS
jgi:hypothetical protein